MELTTEDKNLLVLERIMNQVFVDLKTCKSVTMFTSKNEDEEFSVENEEYPLVIYIKMLNEDTKKEEYLLIDFFEPNDIFTINRNFIINGENFSLQDYKKRIVSLFDEIKTEELYLGSVKLNSEKINEELKEVRTKVAAIELEENLKSRPQSEKKQKI